MTEAAALPLRPQLASTDKVLFHRDKTAAFLAGERFLPATLELDITTECDLGCAQCASAGRPAGRRLGLTAVRRLLGLLAGETRGLLLSGGEPTASPDFPAVVRAARDAGFVDVVLVSNGSRLDDETVVEALLADVSALRISLYDWDRDGAAAIAPALRRLEALRARADRSRSRLEIGVSALTSGARAGRLAEVARRVEAAGAHWIYFHPFCTGWTTSRVVQVDQGGVVAAIENCRRRASDGFDVLHFQDRYEGRPLDFDGYHACHFLLVVGADGRSYLSTELKYRPEFAFASLDESSDEDFLFAPARLAAVAAADAAAYPAMAARHRGVLYSDLLARLRRAGPDAPRREPARPVAAFRYPHIL